MIYEIENKPYMKVENRYVEVIVAKDGDIKPAKNYKRIYCEEVKDNEIQKYTIQDYIKKINSQSKLSNSNLTKKII